MAPLPGGRARGPAAPRGGGPSTGIPGGRSRQTVVHPAHRATHHRGFWGEIAHVGGQTLTDLKDVAVNLPGGLYHTAGMAIHHPVRLGEQSVKQTYTDIRHPLRHPGYTLLDVLGVAGGGAEALARFARVAETGRAAALLSHAPAGERVFRVGDVGEVRGVYARSALARRAQKTADVVRERHPELRVGLRNRAEKIGHERVQAERIKLVLANRPAHELIAATRKLKPHERLAMRVVAEEVPLKERIADAEKLAKSATGRTKRLINSHLKLLHRAEDVVHDVPNAEGDLVPRFKPKHDKLVGLYEKTKAVAEKSEAQKVAAGMLSPEGAKTRRSAPGRIFRGQYELEVDGTRFTGSHLQIAKKLDTRIRRLRKQRPAEPLMAAEFRDRIRTLQEHRDQLRGQQGIDIQPEHPVAPGEPTDQVLETRLAELDDRYNKFIDNLAAAEGAPGDYADLTRRRNMVAKKRARKGLKPLPTVREELRSYAESKLLKLLRNNPHEPRLQGLVAEIEEAHAIRDRLNARAEAAIFGEEAPHVPDVAAHGPTVTAGFNPDTLPELFHNREGFYVSYKTRRRAASLGKQPQIGAARSIGIGRAPSEMTHALTGEAMRTGNVLEDTPKIVAQSAMETNRFLSFWRQRHELAKLAVDSKLTKHHIPIRPVWLKNKPWPDNVRAALDGLDQVTDPTENASRIDTVREWVFPKPTQEVIDEPGIKWVDSRKLGKMNLPRPLVGIGQHVGAKRALAFNDAVNNAERVALLYAKPAYAVPNIVGNVALNLIQGVYSPRNLATAARWARKLDPETHALEDALMGEGVTASIAGENLGKFHKVVEGAAKVWQPLVDTRFRRAAFRYEARRAGYDTVAKYKTLLTHADHEHQLIEITRRANSAIIDYGRLGPVEQDLVRRIVFLYPWTKGATVYAGHFLAEHPIQAAVAGQLGAEGKRRREQILGDVPSWAEALLPVGHRGGTPLVSNPASAAIFQTPASVLEAAREAVGGNVRSAYDLASFLSPTGGAALAALSRREPFTGYQYKPSKSAASIFAENLYSGIPALTLEQRLRKKPSAKTVYPMTSRDALLQFLVGGIAPRPVNVRQLHARAKSERTGR